MLTLEDLERFWEEAKKDHPDLVPSDIRQLIKTLERSQEALKPFVKELEMNKESSGEDYEESELWDNQLPKEYFIKAKSAIISKRNE